MTDMTDMQDMTEMGVVSSNGITSLSPSPSINNSDHDVNPNPDPNHNGIASRKANTKRPGQPKKKTGCLTCKVRRTRSLLVLCPLTSLPSQNSAYLPALLACLV